MAEPRRALAAEAAVIALLAALTTALFGPGGLDLAIERVFRPDGAWTGESSRAIHALYTHGPLPAVAIAVAAALVGVGAWWVPAWRAWRREALAIALAFALGPGLLVNLVCKDHLGRPRPRETLGLGGDQPYVPPATWSPAGGHGFPSGHAAAGFSLCSAFIALRPRRPRLARVALALALGLGALLGYARMSVGAHYPSDVLWSLWLSYLAALSAWALVARRSAASDPAPPPATHGPAALRA